MAKSSASAAASPGSVPSPCRVRATGGAVATPADPATVPELPRAVTEALLARSAAIAHSMTRRLRDEVELPPPYREDPRYLRMVLRACRDGLHGLLRQLHEGRRVHPAELASLGVAGALQAEMDVPLEVLLQGYRVAAKVVWREVVDEAVRLGALSPPTVVALSEQVLEYLDGLSLAVGAAYLDTRERRVRSQDRDRDSLLARLVAGDASAELRRQAATLQLSLRPPYRVMALRASRWPSDDGGLAALWAREGAHVVSDGSAVRLLLVDPAVTPAALCTDTSSRLGLPVEAGVGPVAATLEEIAQAARRARDALLVGERLEAGAAVHDHAELGPYAAALADPEAVDAHVEALLGPVLGRRQAALLETLGVLVTSSGPAEAADRLGVHRHTVAYRVTRLERLLGIDLDDPVVRHRLWLALRLRDLRDGNPVTSPSSLPPPRRERA